MHSLSSLNLTLFDRRPLHPQINQILGDFTSLMLLSWHPGESWLHSAQSLQRLSQNLNHRDVSAIRVMRQLAQRQNVPAVPMPVVFTSALGFEQDNFISPGVICSNRSGASPRRRRSGSITRFMNPKANCALTGILSPLFPCRAGGAPV